MRTTKRKRPGEVAREGNEEKKKRERERKREIDAEPGHCHSCRQIEPMTRVSSQPTYGNYGCCDDAALSNQHPSDAKRNES